MFGTSRNCSPKPCRACVRDGKSGWAMDMVDEVAAIVIWNHDGPKFCVIMIRARDFLLRHTLKNAS